MKDPSKDLRAHSQERFCGGLYRKLLNQIVIETRLGVPRMMPRTSVGLQTSDHRLPCSGFRLQIFSSLRGVRPRSDAWRPTPAGSTCNRKPSTLRTTTVSPVATLTVDVASQSSPWTNTVPLGVSGV